jgi:hypothetical protein
VEAIMANHSPNPDNYTENKTWDEIMDGKTPAEPVDDFGKKTPEPENNPARSNGGGTKSAKPAA